MDGFKSKKKLVNWSPKKRKEGKEMKEYFKTQMAENFPKLMENIN